VIYIPVRVILTMLIDKPMRLRCYGICRQRSRHVDPTTAGSNFTGKRQRFLWAVAEKQLQTAVTLSDQLVQRMLVVQFYITCTYMYSNQLHRSIWFVASLWQCPNNSISENLKFWMSTNDSVQTLSAKPLRSFCDYVTSMVCISRVTL